MKEQLKKAGSALLYAVVSFDSNEDFYNCKTRLASLFREIQYESKLFPKWENEFNLPAGKYTRIVSFKRKISREELPDIKSKCIKIQNNAQENFLSISPGYITPHNIVLSSSLDDFHRIYLFNGVYAEILYTYEKQKMIPASSSSLFARNDVIYFFTNLRETLVNENI